MRTMFGLVANRLVADAAIKVNNNRRNFMMKFFVFREPGLRFLIGRRNTSRSRIKKRSPRNGE
jgi:hypothetical protein